MRTSTVLLLLGVGALGVYWWRHRTPTAIVPVPSGASIADALTAGLESGIEAGTYDAQALRNQMLDSSRVSGSYS